MSFVSRSSPAERAALVEMHCRQREQVEALQAEIARLIAERDRYRDTLGWYAEANTYRGEMAWEAGIPFYRNEPISNDIGQRARDALRGPTNAARG